MPLSLFVGDSGKELAGVPPEAGVELAGVPLRVDPELALCSPACTLLNENFPESLPAVLRLAGRAGEDAAERGGVPRWFDAHLVKSSEGGRAPEVLKWRKALATRGDGLRQEASFPACPMLCRCTSGGLGQNSNGRP